MQNQVQSHPDISLKTRIIAASSASVITSLFMTPLDVIKIRLQTQQFNNLSNNYHNIKYNQPVLSACRTYSEKSKNLSTRYFYSFMNETFKPRIICVHHYIKPKELNLAKFVSKLIHTEGFPSLWSGFRLTVFMILPSSVIYLTTYEQLLKRMKKMNSNNFTSLYPIFAGTCARVLSVSCTSPFDLIRTRLQSSTLNLSYVVGQIFKDYNKIGLASHYRGFKATLLRDVPFSAIYWYLIEQYRFKMSKSVGQLDFKQNFVAGFFSGAIASVVTLPFDIIKTHNQIDPEYKSKSIMKQFKQLYLNNGLKSLSVGMIPRLIKTAPSCAILISTYEYTKKYLSEKEN
ncbi:Solute carrier family 25 member 40 [Intoshia linei]|uniref:Solute carrier family 25 member 40 n=1 Tax=Intoshia linei TaxID=1819745 RepID=A0A177BBI9_9BILA|nr:Solute carrier family 25 member 40 [Intoshia linei]